MPGNACPCRSVTDIEWRPHLSVERYLSSGDLSLSSVSVAAPGLVSFTSFSLGIEAKF